MALGSPQWMYSSGSYEIDQSLKFNDDDTAYLSKTFASSGNTKKWTYSCWYKRGDLDGQSHTLFATNRAGSNDFDYIRVQTDDSVYVAVRDNSSNYVFRIITNRKLRDPSAWYHILVKFDSTASTPSSTDCALYINGVRETDLAGEVLPSQNDTTRFNSNVEHYVGQWNSDSSFYLDGHLAEVNFIDGQALNPSDFGKTGTYGEWKPKEYSGTYGTNGFYLPFKNDYSVEGFSATTYKGAGETRYVGGTGFRPSLNWIKRRNGNGSNRITDIVRGAEKTWMSDDTGAEYVGRDTSAFKPDGFTNGGNSDDSGDTYVAWSWDMGANTSTGFGCVKWTGNATARSIGDVGFSPDLIIERNRDDTTFNLVYDKIRGAGKALRTNSSNAESSYASDEITAFEPDGFRVSTGGDVNANNQECIAWCWDMGGTTATNTTGTITSTVMANPTYGQSILSWTGTGATGTVGTGLTSDAELVIVKNRDTTDNWSVSTTVVDGTVDGGYLNNNSPLSEDWSSRVDPSASTSNTIGVYNWDDGNKSGSNMIGYAFHSVANYSKIGMYTGNGSTTGPSVNIGFRPAFLMIKVADRTDGGNGAWWVFDSTRSFGTAIADVFIWNTTGAELHNNSNLAIDFLDNGFQLKSSYDEINVNNGKYVYMAFAGGVDSMSAFNTDGTSESRVKANTTYGQSIVTYKGKSGSQTVGHGLDSAPEVIIVKNRDVTNESRMYHASLPAGGSYNAEQYSLRLDSTAGEADSTYWNDTAPTSSVFSVGDSQVVNSGHGNNYVAYCWHSVSGYSKINRYTGNGSSTGTVVNCGFRPAFVVIKNATQSSNFYIYDNVREAEDEKGKVLHWGSATGDTSDNERLKFTDTGFQLTHTDTDLNGNGTIYVYMAFADKREYAYWLDQSGNNNDWTSNNLTESDISVDSPSNNFATLNPLDKNGTITLSEGNLYYNSSTGMMRGTMAGNANDKFYLEYLQVSNITGSNPTLIGIGAITEQPNHESNHIASVMCHLDGNSQKRVRIFLNNSQAQSTDFDGLVGYDDGDILQFAYDGTTGKVWVGRNGTWLQGDPATGTSPIYTFSDTSHPMTAFVDHAGVAHAGMINFGQDSSFGGRKTGRGYTDDNGKSDFYYEPPSGFLALSSENLKDNGLKPSEHFNTVLYSGNGSDDRSISVGFQPNLVWLKARSQSYNHYIYDSVRGANKQLLPHVTNAEQTTGDRMQAFESNGFQLGTSGEINQNSQTYVAWNWKAGTSVSGNSSGSGTTTSYTGSVNTDAGFSIIKYTGNATAGLQIPHHLGVVPDAIFIKSLTVQSWNCFFPNTSLGATKGLQLDNDGAEGTVSHLNNTMPTTSVVTLGTGAGTNTSADGVGQEYIMYCWANKDGYSKVGYYKGNNNNNGSFVYTGFKPAFVLIKNTGSAGWHIKTAEVQNNEITKYLYADTSGAENDTTNHGIDFLSNGFKLRTTAGYAETNGDGNTIVYMAFAEVPQKYSNAR